MFNEFFDVLFNRFSTKATSSGIPVSEMPRFADAIMGKSEVFRKQVKIMNWDNRLPYESVHLVPKRT